MLKLMIECSRTGQVIPRSPDRHAEFHSAVGLRGNDRLPALPPPASLVKAGRVPDAVGFLRVSLDPRAKDLGPAGLRRGLFASSLVWPLRYIDFRKPILNSGGSGIGDLSDGSRRAVSPGR